MKNNNNKCEDEWSAFADLMATIIEKYAGKMDLDSLPDPPIPLSSLINENKETSENKESSENKE